MNSNNVYIVMSFKCLSPFFSGHTCKSDMLFICCFCSFFLTGMHVSSLKVLIRYK